MKYNFSSVFLPAKCYSPARWRGSLSRTCTKELIPYGEVRYEGVHENEHNTLKGKDVKTFHQMILPKSTPDNALLLY